MKKLMIVILVLLCIVILPCSNCYAISDDFKFVIDTIGIPRYNVYSSEINEDIYYTYNVFVYSSPTQMIGQTSTQRFKETQYGYWTKEGGKYNGYGTRGEYYVLGTTYSGAIVDNVFFPVDAIPEITPDRWNYISFNGALESWNDTNNYKYTEQLEYMKNTQMLFDSDNFKTPPTGLMDLKPYNVVANLIGLDKARLNTASTWKTMGVISTKRINNKGQTRNAIFATAPMAANANIKSSVSVNDKFELDKSSIDIPIEFSAQAINLNNYAKPKHIKEITSILYIDNVEVARVSNTQTTQVSKHIDYAISRDKFSSPGNYKIKLKVVSFLYTEFYVDGLMKDVIEKDVVIQVNPNKIVPVENIDIGVIEKNNNNLYVKPFVKTATTNQNNSYGLVEKQRHVGLKLDCIEKVDDITTYINGENVSNKLLKEANNKVIIQVDIPDKTPNTLASWNYLRDKNSNYFNVDFSQIGTRVKTPNVLKIEYSYNSNKYSKDILFDTIDDYMINLNYIFNDKVINTQEVNNKINISDW